MFQEYEAWISISTEGNETLYTVCMSRRFKFVYDLCVTGNEENSMIILFVKDLTVLAV